VRHTRLLLRPADVQHALLGGELGQEPPGDLVLALTLPEAHQLQVVGGDEVMDVGDERLGHRVHQRRRRILVAAVPDEESGGPATVGQPGHPHVEVHPIDALHLEAHMIGQHVGNGAG
jgi:hypothetical protein